MISLIYGSTATKPMSQAALIEILEVSRRNNQVNDITGMLLYGNGNFLQVLEGEANAVERCFERISLDERHQHVLLYQQQPIAAREFPEWEMAFYNLSHNPGLDDLPGYSDFLEKRPDQNQFVGAPSKAYTLLRVFRDGMR